MKLVDRLPAACGDQSTSTARCGRRSSSICISNAFKFTFEGEIEVSLRQSRRIGRAHRARHGHGHSCRRDSASVRTLPSRKGRARALLRGERHRSRARAGAGQAARRQRCASRARSTAAAASSCRFRSARRTCLPIASRPRARLASTGLRPEAYVEEVSAVAPGRANACGSRKSGTAVCGTAARPSRPPAATARARNAFCSPTTTPTCASTCGAADAERLRRRGCCRWLGRSAMRRKRASRISC